MSILHPDAVYARDIEYGKIYIWNMFEVQRDKEGKYWIKNVSSAPVHGINPGEIAEFKPDPSGVFYYSRSVEL